LRRLFAIALFSACFQLAVPTSADAFWRFISEWSGPGPYNGLEIDWRVVCFSSSPSVSAADAARRQDSSADIDGQAMRTLEALIGSRCFAGPTDKRQASFNVAFGLFEADDNNLQYATSMDTDVNMTKVEPSFVWRAHPKVLDIGVGAGLFVFNGPAFKTFSRFFIEPIRVDLRPFNKKYWDSIVFKAGVIIVPVGADARDFGAVPGTYHRDREFLWTVGVGVDLNP
jgi:hypothetical protein